MSELVKTEKVSAYEREDKRCIVCKAIIGAGAKIVVERIITPFCRCDYFFCSGSCHDQYKATEMLAAVFTAPVAVQSSGSG